MIAYALQITKNTSNMLLGTLDVWKAHSFATEVLGGFLRCLGEISQNRVELRTVMTTKTSTSTVDQQHVDQDD